MDVMKLLCLLFCVSLSACFDWTTNRQRSSTSRSDNKCSTYPPVDCFTKGYQTNAKHCKGVGCKWCPRSYASKQPWCVTGDSKPKQCKINPVRNCLENESRITKKMCDAKGCFWCPKKKGPWCVKGAETSYSTQNYKQVKDAATAEATDVCLSGTVPKYIEKDTCCKVAPTSSCGTKPSDGRRILGGSVSEKNSWPWMINYVPWEGALCGAVLINSKFALTAGHCVAGMDKDQTVFEFGRINSKKSNKKSGTYGLLLKRTVLHPNFNRIPRLVKDIGIIEFDEPLELSNSIHPICLPNRENPLIGARCMIAGWGSTVYGGYTSKQLREAEVKILEHSACKMAYGSTYDSKKMICAGHMDGSADSCQGDSGGPLMCQRCSSCQWYVAGLVSYGRGCGRAGYPGVYTRVSAYEYWLKKEGVISKVGKSYC